MPRVLQGAGSAEAEDIGQAVGGNGHGTARSTEGIPGGSWMSWWCIAVPEMWLDVMSSMIWKGLSMVLLSLLMLLSFRCETITPSDGL